MTAFALLGLLCGSAAAAGLASERAGSAVSVEMVADELQVTQREVHQALVEATMTTSQKDALMGHLSVFVRNYTRAVANGDADRSLEEYLAAKVTPRLEGAALSTAETERVLTLTSTWVSLELAQVDAGRLDREVRR